METETACHTFGPCFQLLKRKIHSFYQIRVDFPAARVNCSPRDSLILFKQFKKVLIESQPPTLTHCSNLFFVFLFLHLKTPKMLRILLLLGVSYGQSQKRLPDAIIFGVRKGGTRALLEFVEINTKVS